MPSWSPEADRRLLLSIITAACPAPPKWDEVIKLMGDEFTAEALKQRYKKIRKDASTELNDPADPSTPKKATPRKRATPSNKKADNNNGDDDESPTKKAKIIKKEPVA